MKKFFTIAAILLVALGAKAQNVLLHYDFGSALYDKLDGRPATTTTVEMFKPDKWGSTFFFLDFDYNNKGVQSAYWEIARELKFWEGPLCRSYRVQRWPRSVSLFKRLPGRYRL